jgi:hypothetical protein
LQRQHGVVRRGQIGLRDDDVEVVELPQRRVAVGLGGEHRAFIRNRSDFIGMKYIEDAREFVAKIERTDGIRARGFIHAFEPHIRNSRG